MEDELKLSGEMLDFIYKSPSCFHAAENIAMELEAEGFKELLETENWKLKAGRKYFIRRNLSTVIAFTIPEAAPCGFQIMAAHSDSPSLRIKENAEISIDGVYTKLNVEKYGGLLCAPWFDRPLSAAGRISFACADGIESRLVNVDRDLLMIPSLAIHMNRDANNGYKYSVQKDMLPLLGDERAKGRFMEIVAEAAGVKAEDILGSDLFLYCRGKGCIWGAENEYVSAPKLDDLQCAFALLKGFLASSNRDMARVYAIFDAEEIGSGVKQGAASTVLKDTLQRICEALGFGRSDYLRLLASSFMASADNAHAVHPNHIEYADLTNHPHMNKGIVVKYSAGAQYSTDSASAALFRLICSHAGVPVQTFCNNSDIPGGRTLGNISEAQVSVNMVDIGLAQLAMHSCFETAGVLDCAYLARAAREFYSSVIVNNGAGSFRVLSPS